MVRLLLWLLRRVRRFVRRRPMTSFLMLSLLLLALHGTSVHPDWNTGVEKQPKPDRFTTPATNQHSGHMTPLWLEMQLVAPSKRPWGRYWGWRCRAARCERYLVASSPRPAASLTSCLMTCGAVPFWPRPSGRAALGSAHARFAVDNLQMRKPEAASKEVLRMLMKAGEVFRRNVRQLLPQKPTEAAESSAGCADNLVDGLLVTLKVTRQKDTRLTLGASERYSLHVSRANGSVHALVHAATFFGARHGLETLAQLVLNYDSINNCCDRLNVLSDVSMRDEPKFPHRGLMVDSGRNFLPVRSLLTTLDAMAASKLNTFHWRLSDAHSFPFDTPRWPRMARHGAYSPRHVYSPRDVARVVEHAQVLGIRVLLEVSAPGHATAGWQWGPRAGLGNLTVCASNNDICSNPPCGQLNPVNDHTYRVLGDLYADLVDISMPTDMFHMGGDEVNLDCWKKSPDVVPPGKSVTRADLESLWCSFHQRSLKQLLLRYGGLAVVWSSNLTDSPAGAGCLPRDRYVVQVRGPSHRRQERLLAGAGYRVVLSHEDRWFLDCGLGPGTCRAPGWQRVYHHRPWARLSPPDVVLGGEACLWGDHADPNSLDALLWPRVAALAERLWSDPEAGDEEPRRMRDRLSLHRERLLSRGVRAAALGPHWCHQNPRQCRHPDNRG
ncbi:probable beta-hexosaminidase fdl [Bacillus rossius redtenbacheri]|uniref:probable beta-hexosaminidase fdl n=1 Tax=Bacillus rossius redtenbacheri TaxID=93214 RepID=UPI002FDEDB56